MIYENVNNSVVPGGKSNKVNITFGTLHCKNKYLNRNQSQKKIFTEEYVKM